MSDTSHIEWTDATWNVAAGCTKVSAGCDHCYIERTPPFRMAGRRFDSPGTGGTTGVQLHPERLAMPLRWRKPRRVFVNSLADLFHEHVPDEYIARVFAVMGLARQHTFQVLTKRHARMRALLSSDSFQEQVGVIGWEYDPDGKIIYSHRITWPFGNIWCGVSVENQQWADIRIPALLDTPAAVRFLSCEPLLAPVELTKYLDQVEHKASEQRADLGNVDWYGPRIGWVITGGESGPGARPMHPDWARSLRDQCQAAGVPYFHKQNGVFTSFIPSIPDPTRPDGQAPDWDREPDAWVEQAGRVVASEQQVPDTGSWKAMYRVGKQRAGREFDGRTWDEYPTAVNA